MAFVPVRAKHKLQKVTFQNWQIMQMWNVKVGLLQLTEGGN